VKGTGPGVIPTVKGDLLGKGVFVGDGVLETLSAAICFGDRPSVLSKCAKAGDAAARTLAPPLVTSAYVGLGDGMLLVGDTAGDTTDIIFFLCCFFIKFG
jgi:hypothetical protein